MSPEPSDRETATAMRVTPVNLLTAEGLITGVGGLVMFVIGMWPPVFNGVPPDDEAIVTMILGGVAFGWGAFVCFGASRMADLSSRAWATAGAVVGVLPLLVGVYAVVVLLNPKVVAGFRAAGMNDGEDGCQTPG